MPYSTAWTLGSSLLLFLLNAFIVRNLAGAHYINEMGSIEAAFIGLARYLLRHWSDQSWFPYWYCGIPYFNTYPPLLHWTVALTGMAAGTDAASAYHVVTAIVYCIAVITFYWTALSLSGDRAAAFFGAIAYSLLSPSAFLIPGIGAQMASYWNPRRLEVLTLWGEGPHLASLALLPLALLALHWALHRRRPYVYFLAALAMAATVLCNWIGALSLAVAVLGYVSAREKRGEAGRAAGVGVFAYLLACPWIPPSNIATIQWNAQRIGGDYRFTSIRALEQLAAVALFAGLWFLLRRTRLSWFSRFAILLTAVFGAICLLAAIAQVYLVPQPERYHLEFELAVCLLMVAALRGHWARLPRHIQVAAGCLLMAGAYHQVRVYIRSVRYTTRPIEIAQRVESRIPLWLEKNLPSERAFLSGSIGFWAPAFADVPQFGGGFDQGRTNRRHPGVSYQITIGESGEVAVLWLKAYGVRAVVTSGPQSEEVYKDFRFPRKFEGLLPLLWRDGDDSIYRVPSRSSGLAYAVRPTDLVTAFPPEYAPAALVPYVKALDDPELPQVEWRWQGANRATATANLKPEHLLSVHMSYHPGWHATVDGQPRTLRADELGQMVVEPGCNGVCTVMLEYDGGMEARLARLLQLAALLGGVVAIVLSWRRPQNIVSVILSK